MDTSIRRPSLFLVDATAFPEFADPGLAERPPLKDRPECLLKIAVDDKSRAKPPEEGPVVDIGREKV
jgi:hypothetical protein